VLLVTCTTGIAKIFFERPSKLNHIKQIKMHDKVSAQNIPRRGFSMIWG